MSDMNVPPSAGKDAGLREEIAEVVYRELGSMVNRDYLIDALLPVVLAEAAHLESPLVASIKALADKWEAQEYKPGAFYPEASAYAQGRDNQAEFCADDLRELLADTPLTPALGGDDD